MNKTYKIMTFGCQMNENDSEKLAGMLEHMGYIKEEDPEKASIVLMNTCAVRENAEERVFGNIGTFKSIKRKNPEMILGVCGCMMQQEQVVNKIKKTYRQVDLVFGTHNLQEFPKLLEECQEQRKRVVEVWDDNLEIPEDIPTTHKYPFKAYVSIMKGCNNFCSYCIVPYTRGREVSRNSENIIKEITALVQKGCLEVTLLGQNVNSYGNDQENDYHFHDLLREINQIEGLRRIRFMTSHPKDLSDEVIEAIVACDKVCPAVHMAFQSGSNRVLKRMNRKYTREHILELTQKIRARVPGVAITTDIIVGFPGETEEDFQDTLDLVKKCHFDSAFSFIYSIREGTPAATYEDQVPEEIKHDRMNRLLDVLHELSQDGNAGYQDQILEVLVEEWSKHHPGQLAGRTASGKLVNLNGTADDIGKIIKVKITEAKRFSLEGVQI